MATPRLEVTVPVDVPEDIAERAVERQLRGNEDEPIGAYLQDHVDLNFEWRLPEGIADNNFLRCAGD